MHKLNSNIIFRNLNMMDIDSSRSSNLLLGASIFILVILEFLRNYLIMPFPGSQDMDGTVEIAYFLDQNMIYFRSILWVIILGMFVLVLKNETKKAKIIFSIGIGVYLVLFYMFNFVMVAEKMFLLPEPVVFKHVTESVIPHEKVIIGVSNAHEALAFPVEILAYHHQVQSRLGELPVIATYCSVCRTGRVFDPTINGKKEDFLVIGMSEYNAMLEDKSTRSWWQQATGEAVAGPLKGNLMEEILSEQMTLASWLERYPNTKILQPDTNFQDKYDEYEGYDRGLLTNFLEKTDSTAWEDKSWVIGIEGEEWARAYDYLALREEKYIQDSLANLPILLTLEKDSVSFHVWNRVVENQILSFTIDDSSRLFIDTQTASLWDEGGNCVKGELEGKRLQPLQAYLEYWHSWRTFRPYTDRYRD